MSQRAIAASTPTTPLQRVVTWWLAQVKHALPPTIFFFVGFNLILWTKRLILQEHGIEFSGFFTAIVAALLVLLCHKFCRCLRDDRRMQHWHRCRVIAIATANKRWMVAIELGTWRCGRIGGAAGSVTAGKGRFFDRSGAMRC